MLKFKILEELSANTVVLNTLKGYKFSVEMGKNIRKKISRFVY